MIRASELRKKAEDESFITQLGTAPKETLLKTIQTLSQPIPDTVVYRIAVGVLGIVVLIGIAGGIYLAANKIDVPDIVVALSSAAVGAIGAMLAPKSE